MEELGLRPLLAGEELDVVHQQHVHRSVALAELEDPVVLDRVDHLVHEALARDVGEPQPRVVVEHVVPDCVHQVGLAEPHPAVDEQRVVGLARRLGHGPRGRLGELVRLAHHEALEGVARIQGAERRDGGRDRRLPVEVGLGGLFAGRQQDDPGPGLVELGQSLVDEARVVALHPVADEVVRGLQRQDPVTLRDEGDRAKPLVERILVDLRLDPLDDPVPRGDAAHRHALSPSATGGAGAERARKQPKNCNSCVPSLPRPLIFRPRVGVVQRRGPFININFHNCGKVRGTAGGQRTARRPWRGRGTL